MSPIGRGPKDSREQLLSHQTNLVDTVFDPAGKRVVLLRADVGLGKSAGLVALVGHLFQADPNARALLLAPGVLREEFGRKLLQAGAPSILVDRYRFREMLEAQSDGEVWPRGTVTILSPDFARQADILESLRD